MGFETLDVERKVLSILRILSDCQEPLGARVIAYRLKDYGVELGERAVRYHLKLMDERGLTRLVGRDGRLLTEQGEEELRNALVKDKVGLAISKIELLAFSTDFNYEKRCGSIPVNVSFLPKGKFTKALQAMKPAFEAGLCVSELVAVAQEGEHLGEFMVPEGSSLDPSEVFIRARMTSVKEAVKSGNGKILANFREIPALCRETAEEVVAKLREAGLEGILLMGNTSEPVCEIPVELNRIGMILLGGMNPIAAAEEAGIEAQNHAMCTVIEYQDLTRFKEL
jgi:repressor of nif and glnA expression